LKLIKASKKETKHYITCERRTDMHLSKINHLSIRRKGIKKIRGCLLSKNIWDWVSERASEEATKWKYNSVRALKTWTAYYFFSKHWKAPIFILNLVTFTYKHIHKHRINIFSLRIGHAWTRPGLKVFISTVL